MVKRLLIANRGEIACRITKTAKAMGMHVIAVYSDVDANARHVRYADEAHLIGPSEAQQSYLNIAKIMEVAKAAKADAIHPGYGFLSENPNFAEAVTKAGMRFVGPSADVIRDMGRKDRAKERVAAAGVPIVPGDLGDDQSTNTLKAVLKKTGLPVLIKARAGGGGKGMRLVEKEADFENALGAAKREAAASFGDDHVIIEKYITTPRHIEVQVFGDDHGNTVHMFERDCSMQRRYQKVIEEAPAPDIPDDMREAMTEAAVAAAKEIGYSGAGTVEFIADAAGGLSADKFWFMEMNTRLQVEHPVTEAITGLDLVEWQLRIANGEPLPLSQDQIQINGHAIEARVYAEDPQAGFLPASGKVEALELAPARIDTGLINGDTVSPHYDPMIAKIIVHEKTRGKALEAIGTAIDQSLIIGPKTNLDFLSKLIAHKDFANAKLDTGLIDRSIETLLQSAQPSGLIYAIASILLIGKDRLNDNDFGYSHFGPAKTRMRLIAAQDNQSVEITKRNSDRLEATIGDDRFEFSDLSFGDAEITMKYNGTKIRVPHHGSDRQVTLCMNGDTHTVALQLRLKEDISQAQGADKISAPMTGTVTLIDCKLGDQVKAGQQIAVMEAMKMELSLTAKANGKINAIHATAGDSVSEGAVLIELDLDDA